jgi:hypothetical protein
MYMQYQCINFINFLLSRMKDHLMAALGEIAELTS